MVRWNVFIRSRQFLLAADGAAAAALPSWVAKAVPGPVVGHVHARVRAEEEREVTFLDIAGWQRGGESPGRCLACRIGKPTTLDEGLG